MIPDIVEIKRLCASGQWLTRIENGKILLHDTIAGETVCIGQTAYEPVRHGRWEICGIGMTCLVCHKGLVLEQGDADMNYCPNCGAKMDEEAI